MLMQPQCVIGQPVILAMSPVNQMGQLPNSISLHGETSHTLLADSCVRAFGRAIGVCHLKGTDFHLIVALMFHSQGAKVLIWVKKIDEIGGSKPTKRRTMYVMVIH